MYFSTLKQKSTLTTILVLSSFYLYGQDYETHLSLKNGAKIIYSAHTGKYGLIDSINVVVLPLVYHDITRFNVDGHLSVEKDNKIGIVNFKGEFVVPMDYENLSSFSNNLIKALKGTKIGFVNLKNQTIIPFSFDCDTLNGKNSSSLRELSVEASRTEDTYYSDNYDKTLAIYSSKFEKSSFSNNLCVVYQHGKYGYIDTLGHFVIPCGYDYADNFKNVTNNKIAIVGKNGKFGVIDIDQKTIVPFVYDDLVYYHQDTALILFAQQGQNLSFIDLSGNKCLFKADIPNKYIPFIKNQKKGLLDQKLNLIIPPVYNQLSGISCDLIKVIVNDKVGFINLKNEFVVPAIYEKDTINNGFGIIGRKLKSQISVSNDGEKSNQSIIEMGDFAELNFTRDGICVVIQNGKYGFINTKGKVIIPIIYQAADNFYGDYALVKKEGKFGVIDKNQTIVIPFQYDDIVYSSYGKFYVVKDGRGYYIDSKGKEINP